MVSLARDKFCTKISTTSTYFRWATSVYNVIYFVLKMLVPIEATQLSMALEGMVAALKDQIVQKFETVRGDRQRELGRLISKVSNILQNCKF